MVYDLEKYREKREKVLGLRKRGLSFGTVSAIVSICIIIGLGVAVVPKAVSFAVTRSLDDAIYKLDSSETWSNEILTEILKIEGIKEALTDKNGARLVVTFNRNDVNVARITAFFKQQGINTTLLNRVGHRQRIADLKEEKKLEAL